MTKTNKIKQKGVSNVKCKAQATILHTKNMFDVEFAKIARAGRGAWDEFEVMGSSDQQEGEYKSPHDSETDFSLLDKRIKCSHVGRKILALSSLGF